MEQYEFSKRRGRLFRKMGKNAIAIVPSSPVSVRNNDVEYPYRQHSDMYYLTGFPEPESVAVFSTLDGNGRFLLFNREKDPKQEIWHGRRAGQEGACTHYAADDAFPISELDTRLPELMQQASRVFYAMGAHGDFDSKMMAWTDQLRRKARRGVHVPMEFISLDRLIHQMRLHKSAAEIRAMKTAAEISAQAHRRCMQTCRPGMYEYQVEAELHHTLLAGGCRRLAYPPIVAGGGNACILHYTENNRRLQDGDLLLIDAGGEFDHYAADITRTFPVNGRFTPEQAQIYRVVLKAQKAAIDAAVVDNPYNQPHECAVRVITEGLVKLGILKGSVKQLIKEQAYQAFYMHQTGHWLGMDVHDVGDYKVNDQWQRLQPGMVLTIEPGIYIAAGSRKVAKKWWNIGVRIEDDVLVTKKGPQVLSHQAPKTIEEIEALMLSDYVHL